MCLELHNGNIVHHLHNNCTVTYLIASNNVYNTCWGILSVHNSIQYKGQSQCPQSLSNTLRLLLWIVHPAYLVHTASIYASHVYTVVIRFTWGKYHISLAIISIIYHHSNGLYRTLDVSHAWSGYKAVVDVILSMAIYFKESLEQQPLGSHDSNYSGSYQQNQRFEVKVWWLHLNCSITSTPCKGVNTMHMDNNTPLLLYIRIG